MKFTLGESAEEVYTQLLTTREGPLAVARELASITIPSLVPPEGYKAGDKLPGTGQSFSAYCINNLASKLMFMAFPPGLPMMKLAPQEVDIQEEIDQDPELWSKMVQALSRLETVHRQRMETTALRSVYTEHHKQLLVAGNSLWKHIKLPSPVYHRMDTYVVKRDRYGMPLVTILEEVASVAGLEEDIKELVYSRKPELKDKSTWEQTVKIYSVMKLCYEDDEPYWEYWQEFEGEMLPDTEVETDFENPPMWPDLLIHVPGSDWGRSYCEEYRGDLYKVENLECSLTDGAAAASLTLLFVKPGSRTSVKEVKEAENLSVLQGSAEDVTAFRLEKTNDFNFVSANLDKAVSRLGRAFLTVSSIQRQAERVTAEEWKQMAQELDQAMGGLYTQIAQGLQRRILMRFMRLHEEANTKVPKLPRELVDVQVVTGVDAMGRSHEGDALERATTKLATAFGPAAVAQIINPTDYARRVYAAEGIKTDGLVKDEDTLAQEKSQAQADAMRQTLVDKGTAPAVKAMADSLANTTQTPTGEPTNG